MKQIGEAGTVHILKTILKQIKQLGGIIYRSSGGTITTTPGSSGSTVLAVDEDFLMEDGLIYHVDTTTGQKVLTLPVVGEKSLVNIKKTSADTNTVKIIPQGASLIQEDVELILSGHWDTVTLYDDGVNWFIR